MPTTTIWCKELIKTPYLFIQTSSPAGRAKFHTVRLTTEHQGVRYKGSVEVWNRVKDQLSFVIHDFTGLKYDEFFQKMGKIEISQTEVVVEYGSKDKRKTFEVIQPAKESAIYNFAKVYLPEMVSLLFKPDDRLEEEDHPTSHLVHDLFKDLFHESQRDSSKIILYAIQTI